MEDEESELGDFNPQNDSDTEEQNDETTSSIPDDVAQMAAEDGDGGLDMKPDPEPVAVPELRNSRSEYDRTIRPGDVVRDQWGGGWLIAFRKKADTVREYDAQNDDTKPSLLSYEGSIGTGATEEDEVWVCFYLNKNNTLAGGRSGPYDFPESRIVRYAYEATDGFKKGRFQDHIQMQVLERLMAVAMQSFSPTEAVDVLEACIAHEFTEEQAKQAREVAEATVGGSDV